jgi:hypothetical protein
MTGHSIKLLHKKLYLDFNVVNYLKDNPQGKVQEIINKFNDYLIIFSPAHVEEIAVSEMRDNQSKEIIDKELNFLYKLAQTNALRPISREECAFYEETPFDCYERVIKYYNRNNLAEELEQSVIQFAHNFPISDPKYMNNIKPEEVLMPFFYKELIIKGLLNNGLLDKTNLEDALRWTFSDIKNKFYIYEAYVNTAANLIEQLGFFREKVEKSRSRLHDVSHIIYAAYCDTFITNDKKLFMKTKAIYSLLNVKTEVIYLVDLLQTYNKTE